MSIACECGNHVWQRASNAPAVILVSPEDAGVLEGVSWYLVKKGYVHSSSTAMGTRIMHRVITHATKGTLVDHANHWPQDNRRENLRQCDDRQSVRNRRKFYFSKSEYKGVSHYKRNPSSPWVARIVTDGKRSYLGHFKTEFDAAIAYDAAARVQHGQFALLNFPDSSPCQ